MKKQSCRNCHNIDLNKKEETEGRLSGRYRYGCTVQRSGFICGFIISDEKLEALVCPNWKGGEMHKQLVLANQELQNLNELLRSANNL